MVSLSGDVVRRYDRFSRYNSPYPSHDDGSAVDLYVDDVTAPSPVAGEVLETRTVRCPPKPYASDEDHLILVDCGDVIARILHVEPRVAAGDVVSVGDSLGPLVRSGFFGQWVDDHLHVGFREPGQNLHRASGSSFLDVEVSVEAVTWDGTGTVVETGPTHVQLDAPRHTGEGFAALASDDGVPLDGGLPHYAGGGVFGATDGTVSLLGTTVGAIEDGRVEWADVAVRANGRRTTGLSLFASQVPFGAKVVFHRGHDFAVGDELAISLEPTADPIRLG